MTGLPRMAMRAREVHVPPPGQPTALDVVTPLRTAREHAAKAVVAFAVAAAVVLAVLSTFGRAIGWPTADYRVEGRVVGVSPTEEGTIVTFEGRGDGRVLRWERLVEDNEWEFGERTEGWVIDGAFHTSTPLPWAGPADFVFIMLSASFTAWGLRRLVGIVIALADVRRGGDPPRHGYAALVDNPLPRSWRDVLLIWWDDPTGGDAWARPAQVLLADDETGAELRSLERVRVWEAWVDTGRFAWMKPRWVGVRDGVFVPHRRAMLARVAASSRARQKRAVGPERLDAAPLAVSWPEAQPRRRHSLPKMLLWRLVAVAMFALASAWFVDSGDAVTVLG